MFLSQRSGKNSCATLIRILAPSSTPRTLCPPSAVHCAYDEWLNPPSREAVSRPMSNPIRRRPGSPSPADRASRASPHGRYTASCHATPRHATLRYALLRHATIRTPRPRHIVHWWRRARRGSNHQTTTPSPDRHDGFSCPQWSPVVPSLPFSSYCFPNRPWRRGAQGSWRGPFCFHNYGWPLSPVTQRYFYANPIFLLKDGIVRWGSKNSVESSQTKPSSKNYLKN